MSAIKYPYLPPGREIRYVTLDNDYMRLAYETARRESREKKMPNCAVIVQQDGLVIGTGLLGSVYHEQNGCERVRLGCKHGEGYDLCEGCDPRWHGEAQALRDAESHGIDPNGADLYLWGHWFCCRHCWKAMEDAGIRHVYLLQGSEILFNREALGNIVGAQFTFAM